MTSSVKDSETHLYTPLKALTGKALKKPFGVVSNAPDFLKSDEDAAGIFSK